MNTVSNQQIIVATQEVVSRARHQIPSPELLGRIARDVRDQISPTVTAVWDSERKCVVVQVQQLGSGDVLRLDIGYAPITSVTYTSNPKP